MLRYFCLIILLLVCIKWSFCYDYMNEEEFRLKKSRKDVRKQRRQRMDGSSGRRQNYDEALAQIDVASFIHKPDLEAINEPVNENFPHARNSNRKRSKPFSKNTNYKSLIERHASNAQKKSRSGPSVAANASPLNVNIDAYNAMTKHNLDPNNEPVQANLVHKQQKKCPLNLKFPFFSHEKAATSKPKKDKKRKLFSFHKSSKSGVVKSTTQPKVKLADKSLYDPYKIRKRSFEERVCPLCKRRFRTEDDNDANEKTNKIIHNSRQYFKQLSEMGKSNTDADNLNVTDEDYSVKANSIGFEVESLDGRNKRDIDTITAEEKERQLKELEEVQRKIDNLDLQFQKLPKGNDNDNSR